MPQKISMVQIREEQAGDKPAIRLVHEKAFSQPQEANLVDKLRQSCINLVSLVAIMKGRLVGHIVFSPVTVESHGGVVQGMGLAPMAVLPEYQRQGIGSMLVQEGLRILRGSPYPFVIVLGHPDYYPRFGFEPASKYGIRTQWENVPDEAFMILFLDESIMHRVSGVAWYRSEFEEIM